MRMRPAEAEQDGDPSEAQGHAAEFSCAQRLVGAGGTDREDRKDWRRGDDHRGKPLGIIVCPQTISPAGIKLFSRPMPANVDQLFISVGMAMALART